MSFESVHRLRDLYRSHHHWLYDLLRRKLGCDFKAQDIAHDTFLKVMVSESLATLREPRAFLTTVANSLVISHWRRAELERAYLAALELRAPGLAESPEERALALEAIAEIDTLLKDLPPKATRAFLLHQLEGLTHAEIALELGVSERMVKKYMAQVMHQLLLANV